MTTYDDNILKQYADSLYRQAQWIVFQTAIVFGCIAFIISLIVMAAVAALGPQMGIRGDISSGEMVLAVAITTVGIVWGINKGRRNAFRLKLQAQQILCQRQIELNTRSADAHGAT